jgi:hypothetical protein
VEIRSYRNVFALERRIYRVENLRLNPAGVPVRGIVYFLALAVALLAAGRLPLIRVLLGALPWYIRDVGLPGLLAALLTIVRIEGRPAHLAGLALARYAAGPRELSGWRPLGATDRRFAAPELLVIPDGSDARLRRLLYTGPGAVLVGVAHTRAEWRSSMLRRSLKRPALTLAAAPVRAPAPAAAAAAAHRPLARARVIALAPGARLEVKAGARPPGERAMR